MTTRARVPHAGALVAMLVIGVGLVAAPAIFQMFDRAPSGGEMIEEFRPFMTRAEVLKLRGFLDEIGAASTESQQVVRPALTATLGVDDAAYDAQFPLLTDFQRQWPAIDADMRDMLDRMDANLDNFEAVDALPAFKLFPWFFVIPGVMVAVIAAWALRRARRSGAAPRGALIALAVLGVGLIAAPAIFQMFSRAPLGGELIDDFRPLMTVEKVTRIQGYFLTIGNGEAQLRNDVVPQAELDSELIPAVSNFSDHWPEINAQMAPVVGVMSDNVDNFAAVDAMPAFPLFPWFFVVPGVLLVVLAGFSLRSRQSERTS